MAEYLSNLGEVHGIKTTTPSQQWPQPPPEPRQLSGGPTLVPRYNQLLYAALHSLPSVRPRSPTHSAFDPRLSPQSDNRLPSPAQRPP